MAKFDGLYAAYLADEIPHQEFYDTIRRIALRVTEREDAASDVVIAVARAIKRGTVITHFSAWVYQVMQRTRTDYLRAEYRTDTHDELTEIMSCEMSADPRYLNLVMLLPSIKATDRKLSIAIDRILTGYSLEESAAAAGLTYDALRKKLSRLKNKVQNPVTVSPVQAT